MSACLSLLAVLPCSLVNGVTEKSKRWKHSRYHRCKLQHSYLLNRQWSRPEAYHLPYQVPFYQV